MWRPVKAMLYVLDNGNIDIQFCNEKFGMNKNYSKKFAKFLQNCLQKNPDNRKTVGDLLEDGFIKERKDKDYLVERIVKGFDENEMIRKDWLPMSLRKVKDDSNDEIQWSFDTDMNGSSQELNKSKKRRGSFQVTMIDDD